MLKGCRGHKCRKGRKPWNRTRSQLRLSNRQRYGVDSWNRQEKQRKIEEKLEKQLSGRGKQNERTNKGNRKSNL